MANFDLSISPPQIELVIKPGSTFSQAYEITNDSNNVLILSTSVESWRPTDTSGSVVYDDTQNNPHLEFSLGNADLRLNQAFRLDPSQKKQLVLKVKADQSVIPGDSYYTFFVTQQDFGNQTPQAIGKIGSHLLISSSATESTPAQLSVKDFTALPQFKDILTTKLHFVGQITNNSSFYTKPSGTIGLYKNNLLVKELILAPQNVLARHGRQINCLTPDQKSIDSCTIAPPFWPGFYTATISIDNQPLASVSFFIFPYYFAFITLTIAIAISLYLRFYKRKSNKN